MLLPSFAPRFFFFFSCSFDLKVGLIGIVHPGKRQTLKSTESSKHLSLPVEVQIHCISMLCGSEISKTMFPFFTAPLFAMPFSCPSLSPGASCLLLGAHREMLWAQSGRWLLPGSWVGSVGWWSTLGKPLWFVLTQGGMRCLLLLGQAPYPPSSPSPQAQSQRSCNKCEWVLSAAASWRPGLVPDNHGITQAAFHSPLPLPPWISSRKAQLWAAANLSIISAFQSQVTVQVSHPLSLPLFLALF